MTQFEKGNFPDVNTPMKPKAVKCTLLVNLSSKNLKNRISERAEYLGISMSKYVSFVVQNDLAKDPQKQYDRMRNL